MKSLLTIMLKDLRLIARDRVALLFLVLVPFVVVTVVAKSLAGSDTGSQLLPVVNEDEGPVAHVLIESLSEYADVVEVDRAEAENLVAGDKIDHDTSLKVAHRQRCSAKRPMRSQCPFKDPGGWGVEAPGSR